MEYSNSNSYNTWSPMIMGRNVKSSRTCINTVKTIISEIDVGFQEKITGDVYREESGFNTSRTARWRPRLFDTLVERTGLTGEIWGYCTPISGNLHTKTHA